jgi:hypothetical protein
MAHDPLAESFAELLVGNGLDLALDGLEPAKMPIEARGALLEVPKTLKIELLTDNLFDAHSLP